MILFSKRHRQIDEKDLARVAGPPTGKGGRKHCRHSGAYRPQGNATGKSRKLGCPDCRRLHLLGWSNDVGPAEIVAESGFMSNQRVGRTRR